MADKPIGKDATGYEILTDAMKALLNQYPGLYENETIKFEELGIVVGENWQEIPECES